MLCAIVQEPGVLHVGPLNVIGQLQVLLATQAPFVQAGLHTTAEGKRGWREGGRERICQKTSCTHAIF